MSKVLFLDLDGPVITNRASMILHYDQTYLVAKPNNKGVYCYDPVITAFLGKFCEENKVEIVMISSWRKVPTYCKEFLDRVHLLNHLHEDWATKSISEFRGDEVAEWLTRHPEVAGEYRIIDDHNDYEGDDMLARYLQVNGYNGIDYETMDKLITWAEKTHPWEAPL